MNTQQKSSPKILTRRIQVLDAWLRGELPGGGWTAEDVMRKAFHRVYAEDVQQESLPPVTDRILKAAMERCRAEHRRDEPDYPKGALQRYLKAQSGESLPGFSVRRKSR